MERSSLQLRRPRMARRLLALILSLLVIGICVGVFKVVGFGTDPCPTFSFGISNLTGVSFGTCQMLFNLVLLVPILRCDLSRIGIGTIANMVGVGYTADLCIAVIRALTPPEGLSFPVRLAILAVSLAAFLVAVAFYMVVDLGVVPYDAVPQLIAARTKRFSYRQVRIFWDVAALSIGWLCGAAVGVTTLVTGFCLGPAIVAVSDRVRDWFE